jgi:DNA-binding NtrC family response regulator
MKIRGDYRIVPNVSVTIYVNDKLSDAREKAEKAYVELMLKHTDDVVAEAAELAGITHRAFRKLMKKHEVEPKKPKNHR